MKNIPLIKKLIVDSSVIVKWLNTTDELLVSEAAKLVTDCQNGKVELFSPELAKYEVGNALVYKRLADWELNECLGRLFDMPVKFLRTGVKDEKMIGDISLKLKITFYDAAFMALAQKLKVPLVTANPKHHKSFPGVKVVDLKNY